MSLRLALRRLVLSLLAVAMLIVLPATLAGAESERAMQASEPTVELDVIGAIPNGPGVTVPIEVTILSPRAARGTVQLRLTGLQTATSLSVPVDVPANTAVRLPLAVPSSYEGVNVTATVTLDGLADVTETFQRWGGEGTATVGLIGVESVGETVGLAIDGGTAAVRELDDTSIRSAGLSQVGKLVVSPGGLRGLSSETQQLVLGWLGNGGNVVVVGPAGSIDDVLPTEWSGGARPGIGRLSYAEADWSSSLLPTQPPAGSARLGSPELIFGEGAFDFNLNGIAELAVDAGLGLVGARSLLIFLGIYALIAGPIAYLILKRLGRLSMAWTALPVLALIFTATAVFVGAGIRGDRNDSHATIVEVQPTGSMARSAVLLTSSLRGERTLDLPAGWHMIASGDLSGNGSSAPISLRPDRDQMAVTMDLEAGGAGVATFEGGAPMFDGALRISNVSAAQDGVVSGRVANGSAETITDVVAIAGRGVAEVGTIEPGQSVDFSVEYSAPFDRARRVAQTEFSFWPAPRWGEAPEKESNVGAANWGQWRMFEGMNAFAPGTVGIVGWSDGFDSPAADISNGRTGLVARVAIPGAAADSSEAGIGHLIMSPPNNSRVENGNFFGSSFVSRIDVVNSDGEYVARLADEVAGFEVWVDGWQWNRLDDGDDEAFVLPPEAFVDGTAWIRTTVPEWSWPQLPGISIAPNQAAESSGESPIKTSLQSGQVEFRNIDQGFGDGFGFPPRPFPVMEPTPIIGDVRDIEAFIPVDVEPGDAVTLTDELAGGDVDTYLIELEAGERIGVQMRSRDHDSYLVIRDEAGGRLAENDDAGGGFSGLDSEIIFDVPESGAYLIEASALGRESSGGYDLVVERGS